MSTLLPASVSVTTPALLLPAPDFTEKFIEAFQSLISATKPHREGSVITMEIVSTGVFKRILEIELSLRDESEDFKLDAYPIMSRAALNLIDRLIDYERVVSSTRATHKQIYDDLVSLLDTDDINTTEVSTKIGQGIKQLLIVQQENVGKIWVQLKNQLNKMKAVYEIHRQILELNMTVIEHAKIDLTKAVIYLNKLAKVVELLRMADIDISESRYQKASLYRFLIGESVPLLNGIKDAITQMEYLPGFPPLSEDIRIQDVEILSWIQKIQDIINSENYRNLVKCVEKYYLAEITMRFPLEYRRVSELKCAIAIRNKAQTLDRDRIKNIDDRERQLTAPELLGTWDEIKQSYLHYDDIRYAGNLEGYLIEPIQSLARIPLLLRDFKASLSKMIEKGVVISQSPEEMLQKIQAVITVADELGQSVNRAKDSNELKKFHRRRGSIASISTANRHSLQPSHFQEAQAPAAPSVPTQTTAAPSVVDSSQPEPIRPTSLPSLSPSSSSSLPASLPPLPPLHPAIRTGHGSVRSIGSAILQQRRPLAEHVLARFEEPDLRTEMALKTLRSFLRASSAGARTSSDSSPAEKPNITQSQCNAPH